MQIVIYTRYSSEMQRQSSCVDQEHRVRQELDRLGIGHQAAVVIKDEAQSGTKETREGYGTITRMIEAGEAFLLAVDDQSRLSRAMTVAGLIQDLHFNGGRFVSAEGIDTDREGWELLVGIHGMKNNAYLKDLAHKVRRGQDGRIRDGNGSAGDIAFGYTTRFVDPNAVYTGRGPKPKKVVVIDEEKAFWVRQAFAWLVEGKSIGEIAREFTLRKVPKGLKGTTPGWHHHEIRRMLSNTKYVGQWVWGKTKTKRGSGGKKKQVAALEDEIVRCERPSLRIVDQVVWDRAQERLEALKKIYGMKDGQKPRGSKKHYTELYPKSQLGGLLFCGACGARLVFQSGSGDVYYGCPNHRKGLCAQAVRVPRHKAEGKLLNTIATILKGKPEWLARARRSMEDRLRELSALVPKETAALEKQIEKLRKEKANLAAAIAGGADIVTLVQALKDREQALGEAEAKLRATAKVDPRKVDLPNDAWFAQAMADLAGVLSEGGRQGALWLRQILGNVAVDEVKLAGKKRGYVQLRFRIHGMEAAKAATAKGDLPALLFMGEEALSSEIVLPLGAPSRMDALAPKIDEMRKQEMSWRKIGDITGLGRGNAFTAWNRVYGDGKEGLAKAE